METLLALRDAMLQLQERTGDKTLAHAVERGRYQLQRVTFSKGRSTVVPLTEWAPLDQHIAALRAFREG